MTKTPAPPAPRVGKPASISQPPGETAHKSSNTLPRLLSLAETGDRLGCSLKTLRRRIRAGELPVIRDGRLLRVHPADLARYVAARRSL
jgi:excisionase family DNA binding protein